MHQQAIMVRHNVEMGHRLSLQPDSKCFHLHGHSWWLDLYIAGPVGETGMVGDLNFADVKKVWRGYLDSNFDHHLTLNVDDPLVDLVLRDNVTLSEGRDHLDEWGITTVPFDPTVENMARLWGTFAQFSFGDQFDYVLKVQEAATNAATWKSA